VNRARAAAVLTACAAAGAWPAGAASSVLPAGWDPRAAANRVMDGLFCVTAPGARGAHDSDFVIAGGRAYVVAIVNDVQPGESADWPFCYAAMSVVNLGARSVEGIHRLAASEQVYSNATLPPGACFVPRILARDAGTLRCFFASEAPGKRQSQIWYRDYALAAGAFEPGIHRARIRTAAGVFDMQPKPFHEDAVAQGFTHPAKDAGLYMIDSFKHFDGRIYAVLNNYLGAQNALSVLNAECDTFEVLGHFNEPRDLRLTEAAVNRLPDGTWLAISRQEAGTRNYTFSTSRDGRQWTTNSPRDFVPNGTSSKPTFDRFDGVYHLGWQEATTIGGVGRSVFNIDVSTDGMTWERKYRFETEKSFQYPTFRKYDGAVYLTVTQGDSSPSRKERIMFGRLE
jgi:hypothetical protein